MGCRGPLDGRGALVQIFLSSSMTVSTKEKKTEKRNRNHESVPSRILKLKIHDIAPLPVVAKLLAHKHP